MDAFEVERKLPHSDTKWITISSGYTSKETAQAFLDQYKLMYPFVKVRIVKIED